MAAQTKRLVPLGRTQLWFFMKLFTLVSLLLLVVYVSADCYLHNPRGSINRLNETSTDTDNQNRLFNSQDNAQGGYCWGPPMTFYEGSELTVEWTTQHACSNPAVSCNMVLQYMCGSTSAPSDELIRDGITTNTIPTDAAEAGTQDGNGNYLYGMHENIAYYQGCSTRSRNYGLFVADRVTLGQLNGGTAQFTRQNNGGGRNGLECPEERDYYPYWHPSPWKDIAVLVDDVSLCPYIQSNSQNVLGKNVCLLPGGEPAAANNEGDCENAGYNWTQVPSWGIPPPDCLESKNAPDNSLGNVGSTPYNAYYNWTLPTNEPCLANDDCVCVLRLRYNVSTGDFKGWPPGFADWTNSGANSPVYNNPNVQVGGKNLTLAMDTTQFGRTFQDRTHTWYLKPRPSGITANDRIFNVNVKGKRGDIVQVYPALEYDFMPNILYAREGDYIHFQWTGCDTNPDDYAGEGTQGTDRSNIVQIDDISFSHPSANPTLFEGADLINRMAFIDQDPSSCQTYEELMAENDNNQGNVDEDVNNCMELNAAPTPYFNAGLVKMNTSGTFYYMSTRNNNFSNRGQKATLIVIPLLPTWAIALLSVGGALFVGSAGVGAATVYALSHLQSAAAHYLGLVSSKI